MRQKLSPTLAAHRRENAKRKRAERQTQRRSPSSRPRSRKEGGVLNRLVRKEPATSARPDRRQQKGTPSRTTSQYSESEDSEGGHWKSKPRRQKSNTYEDDLSQP
ncbi:hypothetical protein Tco_1273127 [Tanacetum coccineum]